MRHAVREDGSKYMADGVEAARNCQWFKAFILVLLYLNMGEDSDEDRRCLFLYSTVSKAVGGWHLAETQMPYISLNQSSFPRSTKPF